MACNDAILPLSVMFSGSCFVLKSSLASDFDAPLPSVWDGLAFAVLRGSVTTILLSSPRYCWPTLQILRMYLHIYNLLDSRRRVGRGVDRLIMLVICP